MLLIHFTSGLPARGPELTSLKHSNTAFSMRNVFVISGKLVTVTEWNKTLAVTRSPKVIARFIPEEVARLYIAYIADVLPFQRLLQDHADPDGSIKDITNQYLFWDDGEIWDTPKISNIIRRHTKRFFGESFGLRAWRDIAIAYRRKYLTPSENFVDLPGNMDMVAEQAGHHEETELHHYALTPNMLHGLGDGQLEKWMAISVAWQVNVLHIGKANASEAEADKSELPSGPLWLRQAIAPLVKTLKAQNEMLNTVCNQVTLFSEENSELHGLISAGNKIPISTNSLDRLGSKRPTEGTVSRDLEARPDKRRNLPTPGSSILRAVPSERDFQCALKALFGPSASWLTDDQRLLIDSMFSNRLVVAKLPTSCGKTLAIMLSAYFNPGTTTIAVVPFNILKVDLMARLRHVGISTSVFDSDSQVSTTVVFVTPEAINTEAFKQFTRTILSANLLARVIFDEVHILLESYRRAQGTIALQYISSLDVPIVWMSATLTAEIRADLKGLIPNDHVSILRPTLKPNIGYHVTVASYIRHGILISNWLAQVAPKNVLILTMDVSSAKEIANMCGTGYISSETTNEQKMQLLADFRDMKCRALIGTSILAQGLDYEGIGLVINYRGGWSLPYIEQSANRGGRKGEESFSIILLDGKDISTFKDRDLSEFCSTIQCRRRVLARALDSDDSKQKCEAGEIPCDNCLTSRPDDYINYRRSFPLVDILRDCDYSKKDNHSIKTSTFSSLDPSSNLWNSSTRALASPVPDIEILTAPSTPLRIAPTQSTTDLHGIFSQITSHTNTSPGLRRSATDISTPPPRSHAQRKYWSLTSPSSCSNSSPRPGSPAPIYQGSKLRLVPELFKDTPPTFDSSHEENAKSQIHSRALLESIPTAMQMLYRIPSALAVTMADKIMMRMIMQAWCLKCLVSQGLVLNHATTKCKEAPVINWRGECEALKKFLGRRNLQGRFVHFYCHMSMHKGLHTPGQKGPCEKDSYPHLMVLAALRVGLLKDRFREEYDINGAETIEELAAKLFDSYGKTKMEWYGDLVLNKVWLEIIWIRTGFNDVQLDV